MDTNELRLQVGTEIRRERESQGLTLKTLAGMVGTSYTHLWKVENGKVSVGLDLLGKLADALDVPLAEIVTRATRNTPPTDADSVEHIQIEYLDVRRKP